jgi:putative flippase GtrA
MIFAPKFTERMPRFVVTGLIAAAVFFAILFALLRDGLPPFPATLVAYALSFGVGYALQHGWTFGAQHPHHYSFPRYLAVQVGCCMACALLAHAALLAGLPTLLLSVITAVATSIISFFASLLWVFPNRIKL